MRSSHSGRPFTRATLPLQTLVIFGLFVQGTIGTHVSYDGRISFRELHSNLLNASDVKSQPLHEK